MTWQESISRLDRAVKAAGETGAICSACLRTLADGSNRSMTSCPCGGSWIPIAEARRDLALARRW